MTIIMKMKDPVSSLTHMAFAALAVPLTVVMVIMAAHQNSAKGIVAFFIFGMSVFLLYTASSVYHAVSAGKGIESVLKKVDHMMIFVLIAGTYTPICLLTLSGTWGICMLCTVWVAAVLGILMKIFWINAPRIFYTAVYVAMGWIVLAALYPLYKAVGTTGIIILAAGGVSYTVGAVIYALKKPRLKFKLFGFHEIFHIFVMAGTVFHVIFMFCWVL